MPRHDEPGVSPRIEELIDKPSETRRILEYLDYNKIKDFDSFLEEFSEKFNRNEGVQLLGHMNEQIVLGFYNSNFTRTQFSQRGITHKTPSDIEVFQAVSKHSIPKIEKAIAEGRLKVPAEFKPAKRKKVIKEAIKEIVIEAPAFIKIRRGRQTGTLRITAFSDSMIKFVLSRPSLSGKRLSQAFRKKFKTTRKQTSNQSVATLRSKIRKPEKYYSAERARHIKALRKTN